MGFLRMFFLLSLLFGNIAYANDVAAVLGYQAATNNEIWQQNQVGFGVKSLLEQALLDHTTFTLLDDKVLFGVKNEAIEQDIQARWMLNENQISTGALKTLADKYKLNDVFWVKITDFESKVSKASLAIFSVSEYQDTLTLEVCHYTAISHTIECQEGEASKSRTLTGVLWKPTDNVRKNFRDSGAGQLSQEAIQQALTELLKR